MSSRFSLIALAVSAALPTVASAVDFSYSGFSTAAYSQSDTNDAQVGSVPQPEGIDKDGSFEIDSKLGLQVTAKFNEMVSATVQGVAYADLRGDWEPRLDWAYVRLQAAQSLSLRAGYLRAPTFMYSDSVFIGYANTWVRPPIEVYSMVPLYQMRGIDATWRGNVGAFTVDVAPYFGDGEVKVTGQSLDVSEWFGLVTNVSYQSLKARIGYSEMKFGEGIPDLVPVVEGLRAVPSELCGACASEARNIDVDGMVIEVLDLGAEYDDGANFLAIEYAKASTGNYIIESRHGAFATYGRRFGNFMPYATYAIARRDEALSSNAIPAVGELADLNAAVNGIIGGGTTDQDSYSLGVRYEIPAFSMVKAALVKLQFDHIDADGVGALLNVRPGFDGKVDMITASFDFIF